METEQVFCGKEKTTSKEKESFVNNIFSSVHKNYDLMNDLMSFGLQRIWKEKFISLINQTLVFKDDGLILDLASGTGDIPIKFLSQRNCNHSVIVSDINEKMLEIARAKFIDKNLFEKADFMIIDATDIPLKDDSIDLCTISFGIRNVSNIEKALSEIYRILKPNGSFLCMEFSPIQNDKNCFAKLYDIYSKTMIPLFGKIIAKNKDAYQYLVDSINTFPKKKEFKIMIQNAGFNNVKYFELNRGLVAIHSGRKNWIS